MLEGGDGAVQQTSFGHNLSGSLSDGRRIAYDSAKDCGGSVGGQDLASASHILGVPATVHGLRASGTKQPRNTLDIGALLDTRRTNSN